MATAMQSVRSTIASRLRSNSLPLNTIPPQPASTEYSTELASTAARILYRSPLPSPSDLPIFVLSSAEFPDAGTEVYDQLLPYVLARLPREEELIGGQGYEIVFFAGGNTAPTYGHTRINSHGAGSGSKAKEDEEEEQEVEDEGAKKVKRPGFAWVRRAHQVLNRVTRKKMQRLWVVHEKRWVRVLFEMFLTVIGSKVRKKVVHVSSMTTLALHLPIEDLLIPPSAYMTDRKKLASIFVPYASGIRAFAIKEPLPLSSSEDGSRRLPRVLRETTAFLLMETNLKIEGLFRISARAQTVEILREAYDRGQKFIIWREGIALVCWPQYRPGHGDVCINQEDLKDMEGYDAHTAAGLIKLWYKELHEPLFPPHTYVALERLHSANPGSFETETIYDILAPGTEFPLLSENARMILTLHLLPLLSTVAEHVDDNKMTPSNLAVCFAPSLLLGPDPMEDMKMMGIIRRILTAMIEKWNSDLAPALGLNMNAYEESLRLPTLVADREDPLQRAPSVLFETPLLPAGQISGITLHDNSEIMPVLAQEPLHTSTYHPPHQATSHIWSQSSSSISSFASSNSHDANEVLPTLPPRPRAVTVATSTSTSNLEDRPDMAPISRKPAPLLHVPPRYSMVVPDQAAALARLESLTMHAPDIPEGLEAEEPDDTHYPPPRISSLAHPLDSQPQIESDSTSPFHDQNHIIDPIEIDTPPTYKSNTIATPPNTDNHENISVDDRATPQQSTPGRHEAVTMNDRAMSIPRKPVGTTSSIPL